MHANMPDAIADVVVPDFPTSLFRGLAQLLDIRQIDFLDELRENHAAFRVKFPAFSGAWILFQRHDLGFERIICNIPSRTNVKRQKRSDSAFPSWTLRTVCLG